MDATRKTSGFTEMDKYMRDFIVELKKEGKELKTLLPMCDKVKPNGFWKTLTK